MMLCFHELQSIIVSPLILLWLIMLLTSLYLLTILIWLTPSESMNSIMINYPNEFIISSSLANSAESKQSKIKFRRHVLPDTKIFRTEFLSSFIFLNRAAYPARDRVDLTYFSLNGTIDIRSFQKFAYPIISWTYISVEFD
jgi:hypothetical protein